MNNAAKLPLSNNQPDYFRHKGIKVKFAEIENALADCDFVKEAVVLLKENIEGSKILVAYIVPEGHYNQEAIAEFLSGKVPAYMMPAYWVCLQKIPLNTDGTLDKSALEYPEINEYACDDEQPSTETETKLIKIVAEIMGLNSISAADNFFRVGGTSIQAIRVISAIRKEFKVDLDVKCFFIYPVIRQLAKYIESLSGIDGINSTDTGAQISQHDKTGDKLIVPIKAGENDQLPLYIVCGGGGTAFTFEKFAHFLDEAQPVYAFQQPSEMSEFENFPDTIEEIAGKYVQALLLSNPEGPYALSGHCIGGAIAFEMARLLKSMGKKIKILAMFDVILAAKNIEKPSPVTPLKRVPAGLKKATLQATLKMDFETFLLRKYPKDAIQYKINSFKSFLNRIYKFQKEDIEFTVFKKFEQKFEYAFENYLLKKYSGNILAFYARDHFHFRDKNRKIEYKKLILEEETKNRWKGFVDSVLLYDVEGEHSTIFESKGFANLVQQHLNDKQYHS